MPKRGNLYCSQTTRIKRALSKKPRRENVKVRFYPNDEVYPLLKTFSSRFGMGNTVENGVIVMLRSRRWYERFIMSPAQRAKHDSAFYITHAKRFAMTLPDPPDREFTNTWTITVAKPSAPQSMGRLKRIHPENEHAQAG